MADSIHPLHRRQTNRSDSNRSNRPNRRHRRRSLRSSLIVDAYSSSIGALPSHPPLLCHHLLHSSLLPLAHRHVSHSLLPLAFPSSSCCSLCLCLYRRLFCLFLCLYFYCQRPSLCLYLFPYSWHSLSLRSSPCLCFYRSPYFSLFHSIYLYLCYSRCLCLYSLPSSSVYSSLLLLLSLWPFLYSWSCSTYYPPNYRVSKTAHFARHRQSAAHPQTLSVCWKQLLRPSSCCQTATSCHARQTKQASIVHTVYGTLSAKSQTFDRTASRRAPLRPECAANPTL
mmetsp:Transcript_16487/g.26119  ORF Transcript_16487/g.26119 Transcript_16487/m.26119 type:complete len:282 (-) Transcript_16487:962-1807(-)